MTSTAVKAGSLIDEKLLTVGLLISLYPFRASALTAALFIVQFLTVTDNFKQDNESAELHDSPARPPAPPLFPLICLMIGLFSLTTSFCDKCQAEYQELWCSDTLT